MPADIPLKLWASSVLTAVAVLIFSGAGCVSIQFPSNGVRIHLTDAQIILPDSASDDTRLAAQELQTHLKIAYGDKVPILKRKENKIEPDDEVFKFYLNSAPQNRESLQEKTGANYLINRDAAYFWGNNPAGSQTDKDKREPKNEFPATLYAVYEFLERECGFRWLAPGELWRVRLKQDKSLKVKKRHVRWIPELFGGRFPRLLKRVQAAGGNIEKPLRRGDLEMWLLRQRAGGNCQDGRSLGVLLPETGLPVGNEKVVYEKLDKRIKKSEQPAAVVAEGALGGGGLQILRDYFIMRNVSRRKESMRESINDFFAAFGPASDEVGEYFQQWSVLYGKEIMPILSLENNSMTYKNPEQLYRIFRENYGEEDFRRGKAILESAAVEDDLTKREKARIDSLRLAHEHAAQTFAALTKLNEDALNPDEFAAGLQAARELQRFRKDVGVYADASIESIESVENKAGDVCGIGLVNSIAKDAEPLVQAGPEWYFRTVKKEVDISNFFTGSDNGFYEGWKKITGEKRFTFTEPDRDLGQYLMASDFSVNNGNHQEEGGKISLVLWCFLCQIFYFD